MYTEVKKDLETSQKDNYYAEAGIYLYKKYIQKLNRRFVPHAHIFYTSISQVCNGGHILIIIICVT